jgi:hypothetical protein
MNITKNITIAAVVTASLVLTQTTQADDAPAVMKMQPMQGMSFDAGNQHAVAYFLRQNGQCRLVVTLAGEPASDTQTFTATRFEATIDAGETTRYVTENGPIDFDCEPTAQMVSVHGAEQVDAVALR